MSWRGGRWRPWQPLLPFLSLLPVLPLLAGLAFVAPSAGADLTASAPGESRDARGWLARIQEAGRSTNFQGTMVFSGMGGLSSSRVWHYGVGDQVYERLDALDGRQQQMVRHNETVHTLWPQSRVAVIEKRDTLAGWGTTPQAVDPLALEQYGLKVEGAARVAGRDAVVLALEPLDGLRYAQRFWVDRASGLMLRADVIGIGADGGRGVLESTAFTEVDIGVKPQPETVLKAVRKLDGYRIVRPQQRRTTLDGEGWTLARPVAGFRLAGCVQRTMSAAADEAPVLQTIFSDGLTHVSLFVEPFQAQIHRSEVRAQQSATATLMTRRGEYWITVVGDVPPATLKLFADALERQRR